MEITSVIIKPKITEKTQIMKSSSNPKMVFVVNKKANKHQVSEAFKALFGIWPSSVNLFNKKPSPSRNMSKSRHNYTKLEKIAYITVSGKDFQDLNRKAEEIMSKKEQKDEEIKESE